MISRQMQSFVENKQKHWEKFKKKGELPENDSLPFHDIIFVWSSSYPYIEESLMCTEEYLPDCGGSSCNFLKSRINLLRAGVDIFLSFIL